MTRNIALEKAYAFALRIVKLSEYLNNEKKEFVLSRKVLDSGTGIGVLLEEANQAFVHADFVGKMSVANKEAFKTNFWLRLLRDSGFVESDHAESILADCVEIQKILVASLKTARGKE